MPLLPLKTFVNSAQSLYAPAGSGGGGGGGGGPNQSFSTITMSSLGGLINFTTTLTFNDLATTNGNDFVINSGIPDTAIVAGFGGAGQASVVAIRAPSSITTNGGQPAISLNMGATDAASAVIASTNPNTGLPSTLWVIADKVRIPNDLTVSSINGLTPGGGGGSSGTISVSTIFSFPGQPNPNTITLAPGAGGNVLITGDPLTAGNDILFDTNISANSISAGYQPGGNANAIIINDPSNTKANISLGAYQAGGAVIAVGKAASGGTSTLTITSDNVNFLQPTAAGAPLSIQAVDTNLYSLSVPGIAAASVGTVGGRNQFYTGRGEIDDCMVSTITAVTGANITALKPLAVSSIVGVSSINGAAYPPAASGPTRTQVPSLQGISVPGTGSATVISADFNPTNGHLYTLTGQVYGQVSQNVGAGSQIMFQIGNNGSVYQAPFPANGLITPFGTNILDVNMTWRHSSAGAERLYCYFWDPVNGANASTFTNAVANMDLIDFGPVA